MIIVTGIIELESEDVWPATTAAAKMVEASEAETGCVSYRFSVDILNPRRFRIYEEWENEAALAAHAASDHMAEFRRKLGALKVTRRQIVKFELPETTSL